MDIKIRPAEEADIEAITRIRNEGIIDRVATLDEGEHSVAQELEWLQKHLEPFGVWVAESEGVVQGWVSLNVFNTRYAYRHVADFSVYVARGVRGQGIGSQLMEFVIAKARERGFHKLVLAALARNKVGELFMKSMAFAR